MKVALYLVLITSIAFADHCELSYVVNDEASMVSQFCGSDFGKVIGDYEPAGKSKAATKANKAVDAHNKVCLGAAIAVGLGEALSNLVIGCKQDVSSNIFLSCYASASAVPSQLSDFKANGNGWSTFAQKYYGIAESEIWSFQRNQGWTG